MRGSISEDRLREIGTKLPVLKDNFLSSTFPDFTVILTILTRERTSNWRLSASMTHMLVVGIVISHCTKHSPLWFGIVMSHRKHPRN